MSFGHLGSLGARFGLGTGTGAVALPPVLPTPPGGFVYLLGADGAYLTGADGAYLLGVAP